MISCVNYRYQVPGTIYSTGTSPVNEAKKGDDESHDDIVFLKFYFIDHHNNMTLPVSDVILDHCHQHLERSILRNCPLDQNQSSRDRRSECPPPKKLKINASMLILVATLLSQSSAFTGRSSICRFETRRPGLQLVPLSKYDRDLSFFSEDECYRVCIDKKGQFIDGEYKFDLSLVEEEDLPDLSRFVVAAFGADAIRLSQDMNAFERALISPAAELLNGYSSIVAFAEVFSGTKQRLDYRLAKMDLSVPSVKGLCGKEAITAAEKDSLILALARPSQDTEDSRIEIVASIELRLQPCDAKIPFSLPWLDKVERRLASTIGLGDGSASDLQPYLSNLCVAEKFRGKRIGRALVRCVENIAQTSWGYNRIYLHVDEDNVAALSLYKSEGYRDVGHRWNPFWAGGASEIGYYVKTITGGARNG